MTTGLLAVDRDVLSFLHVADNAAAIHKVGFSADLLLRQLVKHERTRRIVGEHAAHRLHVSLELKLRPLTIFFRTCHTHKVIVDFGERLLGKECGALQKVSGVRQSRI